LLRQKGFLGPIGDDLPSLIPLLFALVIFFSVFTFTFNVFEKNSAAFEQNLEVLKLVRVLKSNGYISSTAYFNQRCNEVNAPTIKFKAGITNAATAPEDFKKNYLSAGETYNGIDISNLHFFKSTDPADAGVFECPNNSDELLSPQKFKDTKAIVKILPIVVEDNRIVKPMHLVVVAWQ